MDLTCAYQPIVNLETDDIFGYEALARDATGRFPAARFAAARADGTLGALDWQCREMAAQGALDAGLRPPLALFVNCEPSALTPTPEHLMPMVMRATKHLNLYAEITERAIAEDPAALIAAIQRMRQMGIKIAIDDVGVDPRSLALLPVIKPDVIKLDLSLVQSDPDAASAGVMNAVRAYAQATDATILAEGVENERHLSNARTLGATLAQGWLFGHPGALPQDVPIKADWPTTPPPLVTPGPAIPADIVGTTRMTRGSRAFMVSICEHLEQQALALGPETIFASSFQHERFFTPKRRVRFAELAKTVAVVVALGEGMPDAPAPGVRGGALDPADRLAGAWTVAVLGPHYRAALVAQDLGDSGPLAERRCDFTMTFEPSEVVDIVTALLARASPEQPAAISLAAA